MGQNPPTNDHHITTIQELHKQLVINQNQEELIAFALMVQEEIKVRWEADLTVGWTVGSIQAYKIEARQRLDDFARLYKSKSRDWYEPENT